MGRNQCAAKGCRNSKEKNKEVSFHRIPIKKCAEWVPLLSNPQLYGLTPQKIYKNYVVCSVHFDDDSFNNIRREHFNDNAIPKRHLIVEDEHPQQQPPLATAATASGSTQDEPSTDQLPCNNPAKKRKVNERTSAENTEVLDDACTDMNVQTAASTHDSHEPDVAEASQKASANSSFMNDHDYCVLSPELRHFLAGQREDSPNLNADSFSPKESSTRASSPQNTEIPDVASDMWSRLMIGSECQDVLDLETDSGNGTLYLNSPLSSTAPEPSHAPSLAHTPSAPSPAPPASVPAADVSQPQPPPALQTPTSHRAQRPLLRRGHNRKRLPPVLRIPRQQRTPVVDKLLESVKQHRTEARRMRAKYLQKSEEVRRLKAHKEEAVLDFLSDKVSPKFHKILRCEVRNFRKKPQGRRFEDEEKLIFAAMRNRGPAAYRGLFCIKPSKKTLKTTMKKLNLKPGINPYFKAALKKRVSKMTAIEKICFAVVDEMALKLLLELNEKKDNVDGVTDLGNGDRRPEPAEEVLIAMIRSIFGKWKLPVAFWFTNKKLTSLEFARMFLELLETLLEVGLDVRAIVTDGLAKNILAENKLGASDEDPCFYVNGKRIVTIVDPPHLIKALRNALLKYILFCPDGTMVDIKFIRAFILQDMEMQPRLAPKVGKRHINPNNFEKMSVPLSVQLLSKSVASGVLTYAVLGALPPEAMATGRFAEKINNFWDSFQGTEYIENPDADNFKCALSKNSSHMQFWADIFEEMEGWHFLGSERVQVMKNWRRTMRAFAILWDDLQKEGYEYLPVGAINQDCQENFNSSMRGNSGHRTNPSAAEFPSAFYNGLINHMTSTAKGKNCRDDNAISLMHFKDLYDCLQTVDEEPAIADASLPPRISVLPPVSIADERFSEEEDEDEDLIEEDDSELADSSAPSLHELFINQVRSSASSKVAAPIVERLLKKTNCEDCKAQLQSESQFPLHLHHTMTASRSETQSSKFLPSKIVCDAVREIYDSATKHLPDMIHHLNITQDFGNILKKLPAVRKLSLCEIHNSDFLDILLHEFAVAATRDFLEQLGRQHKEKKKLKTKSAKLKRVSHL